MVIVIGRFRYFYVDFEEEMRDEGVRRNCSSLVKVGFLFRWSLTEEKVKESFVVI